MTLSQFLSGQIQYYKQSVKEIDLFKREMKQRTVELSQKISSEDGISAAIRLIET